MDMGVMIREEIIEKKMDGKLVDFLLDSFILLFISVLNLIC